jgi:membrane glycosyltransferase
MLLFPFFSPRFLLFLSPVFIALVFSITTVLSSQFCCRFWKGRKLTTCCPWKLVTQTV